MYHGIRRIFRATDWTTFITTLTLSAIGLLFVFSATFRTQEPFSRFFYKQAAGIGAGIAIFFIISLIDFRTLTNWSLALYAATMALLCFTLVKGSIGMGAQRWIDLGFIKFQPSELAKLFFPAFVVQYLKTEDVVVPRLHIFFPILGILASSAILILKQPDLGTALIIVFVGTILLWLAGIGKKFFMWSIFCALVGAPVAWHHLKPYQKQRIAVFLGEGNKRKERYHIEQSAIAIGSGGLTGKGFLQGTQNKLQFLPESRTDFIFAVLCEEWGFWGALLVLFLYFILFARIVFVVARMNSFYAQLLAIGIVLHIILSALINIGMVIGLLPVVGIPLPFMSYGISHLLISFASLGWYNSIACRRFYAG